MFWRQSTRLVLACCATIVVGALAISTASAQTPCGNPLRANCEVPGSPPQGHYLGSDSAGRVGFVLARSGQAFTVHDFHFTNKCAVGDTRDTTVRTFQLGPRGRLRLRTAGGITVNGSVYRAFTGNLFSPSPFGNGVGGYAHGTVRVHTATCDSGTLRFNAPWVGA
jgi:hypothetical protein